MGGGYPKIIKKKSLNWKAIDSEVANPRVAGAKEKVAMDLGVMVVSNGWYRGCKYLIRGFEYCIISKYT